MYIGLQECRLQRAKVQCCGCICDPYPPNPRQVPGLEPVVVPVRCNVSGCPLVFHGTATTGHTLVRWGCPCDYLLYSPLLLSHTCTMLPLSLLLICFFTPSSPRNSPQLSPRKKYAYILYMYPETVEAWVHLHVLL